GAGPALVVAQRPEGLHDGHALSLDDCPLSRPIVWTSPTLRDNWSSTNCPAAFRPRLRAVSTIAELAEDRVVEGVYAVARKRRLRTKSGSPYLALELVDPSGRIEGRVWNDVDLLDGRFGEGDAVRVLGRVERRSEE